jgi:hypothetical protein
MTSLTSYPTLAQASTVGTRPRASRLPKAEPPFAQALGLDLALVECLGRALGPEGTRPKGGGRLTKGLSLTYDFG